MKQNKLMGSIGALAVGALAFTAMDAGAVTITSVGAGTSVTSADRVATFGSLTGNGIDLSAYTENSLQISVPDFTFIGFDAFNGASGSTTAFQFGGGGNNRYVTIKTTDSLDIFGLEFLYGNGYLDRLIADSINTVWQTWKDGSLVSSGNFIVARGTVVGWSDTAGFDELRVASGQGITQLGQFQGIALDNVRVQLSSTSSSPIPAPDGGMTVAMLGMALGGLGLLRRKF